MEERRPRIKAEIVQVPIPKSKMQSEKELKSANKEYFDEIAKTVGKKQAKRLEKNYIAEVMAESAEFDNNHPETIPMVRLSLEE